MIEKIRNGVQDWLDACRYANECAPDLFDFAKNDDYFFILMTICLVAGFWLANMLSARERANPIYERGDFGASRNRQKARLSHANADDGATIVFVSAISAVAQITGLSFLLFPEIGALSNEVFRKPHGAWANGPLMLIVTPFCTGLIGTVITQVFPYGALAVLVSIIAGIIVIRRLGSPVTPAISAGLLPVTLGDSSWWYPSSLLLGATLLSTAAYARRRIDAPEKNKSGASDESHHPASAGRDVSWIPFLAAFFLLSASLASLTGWRFLMFPPLAVIAFEMFAHASICPWAQRPLLLPVAGGLTITAGIFTVGYLGNGVIAVALTMLFGVAALRMLAFHAPPALAVGLLPFVMPRPDYLHGFSVVCGAALLTFVFLLWRKTKEPVCPD